MSSRLRAEVDGEDFEERCQQAAQARGVDPPRVLPDGMASIFAVMPATEAIQLFRSIDAAARSAKATGDERTLDQLRADALALMGENAVQSGWIGACPRQHVDDASADSAAPADGERAPDCGMPVGAIGGRSAHVRVMVPLTSAMGGEGGPGQGLEGADAPAELEGYGPIPASVARALAAGGPWARMVTDPLDRTVLEVSRDRYRPTRAMADLVRAREPECIHLSCGVSSDRCDIHHRIPWPIGLTTVTNLDPPCRRHHLLLTHAGWRYAVDARGRRTWTTPTGLRYVQELDGTVTMYKYERRRTTSPPPNDDDPPPF